MRKSRAPEQSHERARKRLEAIEEGFQGVLAADGIAQQNDHKIDGVILSEPLPGKAHAFCKSRKHTKVLEVMGDERHFAEPGRR